MVTTALLVNVPPSKSCQATSMSNPLRSAMPSSNWLSPSTLPSATPSTRPVMEMDTGGRLVALAIVEPHLEAFPLRRCPGYALEPDQVLVTVRVDVSQVLELTLVRLNEASSRVQPALCEQSRRADHQEQQGSKQGRHGQGHSDLLQVSIAASPVACQRFDEGESWWIGVHCNRPSPASSHPVLRIPRAIPRTVWTSTRSSSLSSRPDARQRPRRSTCTKLIGST